MQYIGETDYSSPVTSDEFKRAVHMGEDDTDDDALIDALILAATELVESATNRPMLPREYEFTAPAGDWLRWWFPVAPVASIIGVAWRDGGEWQDLDISSIKLERAHDEPQMVLPAEFIASSLGAAEIRVQAVAGFAAGKVPLRLKQAVILTVKDWLEAGIAVEQTEHLRVSFGCKLLIRQGRYARPMVTAAL